MQETTGAETSRIRLNIIQDMVEPMAAYRFSGGIMVGQTTARFILVRAE